jgi:hypothetical protein
MARIGTNQLRDALSRTRFDAGGRPFLDEFRSQILNSEMLSHLRHFACHLPELHAEKIAASNLKDRLTHFFFGFGDIVDLMPETPLCEYLERPSPWAGGFDRDHRALLSDAESALEILMDTLSDDERLRLQRELARSQAGDTDGVGTHQQYELPFESAGSSGSAADSNHGKR